MRKIQALAEIKTAQLPDALREANGRNETVCVRLEITYAGGETNNETLNALLKEVDSEVLEVFTKTQGGKYSYLIHMERMGFAAGEDDKALEFCTNKLVGKKMLFTTYIASISEIVAGTKYEGATAVHSESRNYSNMNTSYILAWDDEDEAFNSIKSQTLARIEDGTYMLGQLGDKKEKKSEKPKVTLPNFDDMSRPELVKFATDNEISVNDDMSRPEIVAAIKNALA